MTPPDLEELRRLRRARDRMDRDFAEPLDVPTLARTALMSTTGACPLRVKHTILGS